MTTRYLVGAVLAIASGAIINLGILVQKKAVNTRSSQGGQSDGSFLTGLVRSPTWLGGLALQFLLGSPMYAAAQLFIGPTLIPGLMATGLVVLALGSPAVAGERLGRRDFAGVGLVVAAVALLGLSRLSVDLAGLELFGPPLLIRFAVATVVLAVGAAGLLVAARALERWRGVCTILASGLAFAAGNLWLGVLMAGLARAVAGGATTRVWAVTVAAAALVIATNLLSMAWTQLAFREGRAAALVPLQQVPIQLIPVASYFAVFLLDAPSLASAALALSGVLLILAGSALVGTRGG